MTKTNQYCVAENWGKGFIEHSESRKIAFSGLPGNVKTRDEAQTIVDVEVTAAQTAWDALSDEEKSRNPRPADIILEE